MIFLQLLDFLCFLLAQCCCKSCILSLQSSFGRDYNTYRYLFCFCSFALSLSLCISLSCSLTLSQLKRSLSIPRFFHSATLFTFLYRQTYRTWTHFSTYFCLPYFTMLLNTVTLVFYCCLLSLLNGHTEPKHVWYSILGLSNTINFSQRQTHSITASCANQHIILALLLFFYGLNVL